MEYLQGSAGESTLQNAFHGFILSREEQQKVIFNIEIEFMNCIREYLEKEKKEPILSKKSCNRRVRKLLNEIRIMMGLSTQFDDDSITYLKNMEVAMDSYIEQY